MTNIKSLNAPKFFVLMFVNSVRGATWHKQFMEMQTETKSGLKRSMAKSGKAVFWTWIAYQTIKGTLTTSLIWIPLIYAWVRHTDGALFH